MPSPVPTRAGTLDPAKTDTAHLFEGVTPFPNANNTTALVQISTGVQFVVEIVQN